MKRKVAPRTRDNIVPQLVDLFFQFGYNGTTLNLIGERTELSRAALYHHFPGGKEEMARAVLERADAWVDTHVFAVMADSETPAPLRLQQVIRNMDAVHHHAEQLTPSTAFVVGQDAQIYRPHVLGYNLRHAQLMTELLIALGLPEHVAHRRSWEFRIFLEGSLACARVMGDLHIFHQMMQQVVAYLLAPIEAEGCLPAGFRMPLPHSEADHR